MGYGPNLIAQLLEAERVQPPRSRWSANAVRRIGQRQGIEWPGLRSHAYEALKAGRRAVVSASLARDLKEKTGRKRRQYERSGY